MKITRCVASPLMSAVLEYRNPEKFWVNSSYICKNDFLNAEDEKSMDGEAKKNMMKYF